MMLRDEIQQKTVKKFISLEKRRGLAILATGSGKAKIAIDIIRELKPPKVLYLCESTTNRDITMKKEITKWNLGYYMDKIEFATYQLAYKFKEKGRNLDDYLVICDEVDFAMTPEYGKFFTDYPDVELFAMTGFLKIEKYRLFKHVLPILVRYTSKVMQENKVLNKTEFHFVQFCLSKTKDITVEYKGKDGLMKSFKTSENDSYKFFVKQESEVTIEMLKAIDNKDLELAKQKENYLFTILPRKRAEFLYNLNSSIGIVRSIVNDIRNLDDDFKVITFSERTTQADKISKYTYHGKTGKDAEKNLEKFKEGFIEVLATCGKVNRGVNIDNLKYSIFESFTRDSVALHQRNGRLMRLDADEVGRNYILMPYYIDGMDAIPTRAVHWARNLLKEIDKDQVRIVNYCGNYNIKK